MEQDRRLVHRNQWPTPVCGLPTPCHWMLVWVVLATALSCVGDGSDEATRDGPADVGGEPDVLLRQDVPADTSDSSNEDAEVDAAADSAADDASDVGEDVMPDLADGGDVMDVADADNGTCPPPPAGLPDLSADRQGRFERYTFPGGSLDDRVVVVYLPEEYDTSDDHYPVLYMHDGQNLFDDREAAFGVAWEVDETIDALVTSGTIEPWIVVGIGNTPARIAEYTTDEGGDGVAYLELVADRIKPFVESRYRVRCGATNTALAGSSLGGLISFEALMQQPGVFGRIGAVSPSFWYADSAVLDRFAAWNGEMPTRLWIDAGTNEGAPRPSGGSSTTNNSRRAVELARDAGAIDGHDLAYYEHIGAGHNEAAWEERLPAILGWLLTDDPIDTSTPANEASLWVYVPRLGTDGTSEVVAETRYADGRRLSWFGAALELTVDDDTVVGYDGAVVAESLGHSLLRTDIGGGEIRSLVQVAGVGDPVAVHFEVGVPADTDIVYIGGSDDSLGPWEADALPLTAQGDLFSATTLLPAGNLEYKYTRGTWETVEKDADGEEIGNRTISVDNPTIVVDDVARWADTP